MYLPKISIIPGNANNLTCDLGITKIRAESWQFLPYKDCPQFVWGDDRTFGFFRSLNPFAYLSNYFLEKTQIQDPSYINKLKEFLFQSNPEILICHSMGCLFLANYLRTNELPKSVKKIILLQADLSWQKEFNTDIPIICSYCFLDYTLWISAVLNQYIPIGVFGSKQVKSKFVWLRGPQFHAMITNQDKAIYGLINEAK
jgi:Serine hydrolase